MGQLAELTKEINPFGLDEANALHVRVVMIVLWYLAREPRKPGVEDLVFIGGSEVLLHVAALISCGLPISALAWSFKHVSVVLVQGPESDVLALVPTTVLQSDVPTTYSLRQVGDSRDFRWGKQFVLVAHRKLGNETEQIACYFPPDMKVETGGS